MMFDRATTMPDFPFKLHRDQMTVRSGGRKKKPIQVSNAGFEAFSVKNRASGDMGKKGI